MPETGVPGRRAAGLVTSLAPMTRATSQRGNSGLISSISLQLRVGHVGLGQQHVHVAGHPAGDRVDGVADVDAALTRAARPARATSCWAWATARP